MTFLNRVWFWLTGECATYTPDDTGLCQVCRIPGAGMHVEGDDWMTLASPAPEDDLILVAIGNPFDGIRLYGPFDTYEDATEWAAAQHEADWWVTDAEAPS